MNILRWKGILWLGSLAAGGYLVFYVYDFLQRKEVLEKEVSNEELAEALDGVKKPEEQRSDHVEASAMQRVFFNLDWTGKEKIKPVAQQRGNEPATPPKKPVATLLSILGIKVDTTRPEQSRAYVKFLDPTLAPHNAVPQATTLHPEQHLPSPFQDVFVKEITGGGVVFAFDDASREPETVAPAAYQSSVRGELGIVVVGPDGVIKPQVRSRIATAAADQPPFRPEKLMQIRKNEFQVGTGTVEELDRDYSRILSRDISASTYKNPRTGETEGIKINKVAANSIPAQAGLTEGEVLKSINGHKVTSVNDAIAFVKANSDTTTTWTAVFDKQGREVTRTYYSP